MGCRLEIIGKTNTGRTRKNNEDSFVIEPDLGFMIVADGMGGHASGEVASRLASTLCAQQLKRSLQTGHVPIFYHVPNNPSLDPRTHILGDCVKFANSAVYEASQKQSENKNMGTTLVAALFLDDKLAIANVGDSRLYLIRGDDLVQCTVDHSFVQEQIDKGLIDPDEAEQSDMKHLLTRCIGNQEDVEVDMKEIELKPSDFILLCSDGLTKMLKDKEIMATFQELKDPDGIASSLIDKANNAGGKDNITVLVAHVAEDHLSLSSWTDRLKKLFQHKAERK